MEERAFVFTPRVSVSGTSRDTTHTFADRSERISSASWNNEGRGTRPTRTLESARVEAEVGIPTRTGGHSSGTDVKAMNCVGSGTTTKYQEITEEVKVMGTAEMETGTDAGTGVYVEAKGIHPNLTTPKTDRGRSGIIRSTVMEVVWDK